LLSRRTKCYATELFVSRFERAWLAFESGKNAIGKYSFRYFCLDPIGLTSRNIHVYRSWHELLIFHWWRSWGTSTKCSYTRSRENAENSQCDGARWQMILICRYSLPRCTDLSKRITWARQNTDRKNACENVRFRSMEISTKLRDEASARDSVRNSIHSVWQLDPVYRVAQTIHVSSQRIENLCFSHN